MRIPLHGKKAAGRVALVDDEDYELVSPYRWHVWEGSLAAPRRPHARAHTPTVNGRRTSIRMHNLITGCVWVDHADGDSLNNQRYNLRTATRSQNGANRDSWDSVSPFKGVSWESRDSLWRVRITVAGITRSLGYFHDEGDAARAYDAAAVNAWGEYARLNFKEDT